MRTWFKVSIHNHLFVCGLETENHVRDIEAARIRRQNAASDKVTEFATGAKLLSNVYILVRLKGSNDAGDERRFDFKQE